MPMPINRVPIFSDSVSIGTDFIGTDWNGIGNGSNFFIGPITDIINSWLTSVSVYQRIVIVSHATLLTKIMLGNVYVSQQKRSVNDWVFNVQTGGLLYFAKRNETKPLRNETKWNRCETKRNETKPLRNETRFQTQFYINDSYLICNI